MRIKIARTIVGTMTTKTRLIWKILWPGLTQISKTIQIKNLKTTRTTMNLLKKETTMISFITSINKMITILKPIKINFHLISASYLSNRVLLVMNQA